MRPLLLFTAATLLFVTPTSAPVCAADAASQKRPPKPRTATRPGTLRPAAPAENPAVPGTPYRDDEPKANTLDLKALVRETQKGSSDPRRMTLVWWVPEEYWRASLENDPSITEAQREEFYAVIRPYTVVIVMDGRFVEGDPGKVDYRSDAAIRTEIKIRGLDGTEARPLNPAEVSEDLKTMLEAARPVFENLLGPMGKNMRVYVFPSRSKEGKPLTDTRATGRFSVFLGNREYRWRLPLNTVLPARKCPDCTETLLGGYKFCPYDGTKLPDPAN